MSITTSWLVLVVVGLRFLLKKVPKSFVVVMWALVGIRLICPFSVESEMSLMPKFETISKDVFDSEDLSELGGNQVLPHQPSTGIQQGNLSNHESNPEKVPSQNQEGSTNTGTQTDTNLGQSNVTKPVPDVNVNTDVGGQGNISLKVSFFKMFVPIGSGIWLAGMLTMFAYSMITYFSLHRKVSISLCAEKDIYLCDEIDTPFIFGIFKPRIYIPSGMETEQIKYVVEHERAHWQRKDHWWKPIGFTLLTIHWFNPVIWLAYILLCRDIELACDEKVIKNMNNLDKKGYSETLLACSVPRRMILACPLAFGEVGVKERVKFMRQYKKPAFWILVVGVVVCIVLAVGFLTNPKEDKISQVMYKDVVYVETTMPEWAHSFIYVGEILSSTTEEVPTENLQANVDWKGSGIYTAMNTEHYIFILEDGAYIAHKNMSVENAVEQEEMSESDISDAIEEYLINYLENYSSTQDEQLNQLVSTLCPYNGGISTDYETGLVKVQIIGSTEEKIELFKEKIMDSKYITFENFTAAQYGYPMEPDPEIDWGLSLSVENLTPRGMTLVFTQSGAEHVEELLSGTDFYLCVKKDGTWSPVEYKMIPAYTSMAYSISKESTSRSEANWELFYGELPAGTYRIGKEISARIAYKYESACFFADFVITNEMITYGNVPEFDSINEYTLEFLQNRLAGHSQKQIHHAWGEPNEQLSGFWGDRWATTDGNSIIVYYDENGIALHVKYQYDNPNGDNIYSAVEVGADWFEYGTRLYRNCLNAELVTGGYPRGTYRIPIYKIENITDLTSFRTNYVDGTTLYDFGEALNFYTISQGMDEEYFEQFTLFVLYVQNYNFSWEHSVTSIQKNGFQLKINIKQSNHPVRFANAREGRFLLVPIEKSQLEGLKTFEAYMEDWRTYDQSVITEVTDSYMMLDRSIMIKNWFYPEYELKVGDEVTAIHEGSVSMTSPGRYSKLYEIFFIDENGERITKIIEE